MLDAGCKIIGYRGKGAGDRDKLVNSPLTTDLTTNSRQLTNVN